MDPNFGAPPMGTPPMLAFPPMMPQFTVPPPGFATFQTAPPANPSEQWTEHKAPGGKIYYYNSLTKQSSWQKPDLLKTPAELLLSQCPWKEYTSDNGKVYYHNVNTSESRWVIPAELEEIKTRIAAEETNAETSVCQSDAPSPGAPAEVVSPPSMTSPGGKSALEAAMAATLAAIAIPTPPPKADDDSNMSSHSNSQEANGGGARTHTPELRVYKDKKEAMEAFKELLKEYAIPSNATWDACVKTMQADVRYESFKRLNERKQVFNAYKTQKQKDEKEESRLKQKRAKEALEAFLMQSDRITSASKYYKCDEIFGGLEVWDAVVDADRRDIYEDVVFALAKREKEESKVLKKRNMKKLAEVLNNMTEIHYYTTWAEAQTMLLGNATFKNDVNLLAMDKEDALIVFEEHIRDLEKENGEERELDRKRSTRQARKNRDQFLVLLDALHEEGKLTSMSLWVELYPLISADIRFSAMLGQTGATPLDLFKFYVEDLKARFHDEKKIIKEILREKAFDVRVETTFEQFATVVCEDKKSATLDAGNVKLTYNSLLEKAEVREKERVKEESKRLKKLEAAFRARLRDLEWNYEVEWEEARQQLADEDEFRAFANDAERQKVYKAFQHEMEESCSHHHSRSKKSKKSKKSRKYRSSSASEAESVVVEVAPPATAAPPPPRPLTPVRKERKKERRSTTPPIIHVSDDSAGEEYKRTKKSKKKHKKREPSLSPDEKDVRKKSNNRRTSDDTLTKSSDLSESELEKQRALLLEQLKTESD